MDSALIVIGLLFVGMLIVWIFTYLSDPKEIGEEEKAQVREQPPEEIRRSAAEMEIEKAERNAEEIAFYSPGESTLD
jgi:hypothetical protein